MNATVFCLIAVALLLAGRVGASESSNVDLPQIIEQQRQVSAQLADGSLNLTPRAQNIVKKAQAEVFSIAEGKATLADLNIAEKTRLENALERINASVVGTRAAGDAKQICKRVPVTGSAVRVTRCASQAEWDDVREQSRKSLEKRQVCMPPGCGT